LLDAPWKKIFNLVACAFNHEIIEILQVSIIFHNILMQFDADRSQVWISLFFNGLLEQSGI
jgi:hypothetical protein